MKAANDALRFLLELAALAGIGDWGWEATGSPARYALVVVAPVAAATVWGVFVSPKARIPSRDPWRLGLEVAVFGAGAAGLALAGHDGPAALLGALAVLHLTLTFPLDQRAFASRG